MARTSSDFSPANTGQKLGEDGFRWDGFLQNLDVVNLTVNGAPIGFSISTRSVTSNTTATTTDYALLCDATLGAITVTLPSAVGMAGRVYLIKKTDAGTNTVTVVGAFSQTFDGDSSMVFTSRGSALVVSDGNNWQLIG